MTPILSEESTYGVFHGYWTYLNGACYSIGDICDPYSILIQHCIG